MEGEKLYFNPLASSVRPLTPWLLSLVTQRARETLDVVTVTGLRVLASSVQSFPEAGV